MVLFGGGEQIQRAGEQIEQVEILACVHLLPCMLQVGLEWCAEAVMAAAEVHAARVPGVSAGFARLRSAPPPPVGSAIPTSPAAARFRAARCTERSTAAARVSAYFSDARSVLAAINKRAAHNFESLIVESTR
jgi:hypothetical protein